MGEIIRPDWDGIRERFIGLDDSLSVKSYYPQLRERVRELEENRIFLEQKSAALINLLEDLEEERRKALESEAAVAALNEELEAKVADRTEQLSAKMEELRDAQDRLILSEKLAALGRLTAGLSHELNSPLGAIESSSATLGDIVLKSASSMAKLFSDLPKDALPVYFALLSDAMDYAARIGEGGDRKRRRAFARKLEGLGAASPDFLAELADEVGAFDYFEALADRFGLETASFMLESAAGGASLVRSAAIIRHAAERAAAVVKALRNYGGDGGDPAADPTSGCEDSDLPGWAPVDVDGTLAVSVELYRSRFRRGVELDLRLESGGLVCSDEASLSQVWMNLIANALQAMDYRGSLGIGSRREGAGIVVEVVDSGPGIPEAIRDRIFDPFFTTKPIGEGNGFGLVVAKRIVERAGGTIGFESRPGNTVFRVSLPAAEFKGEPS